MIAIDGKRAAFTRASPAARPGESKARQVLHEGIERWVNEGGAGGEDRTVDKDAASPETAPPPIAA